MLAGSFGGDPSPTRSRLLTTRPPVVRTSYQSIPCAGGPSSRESDAGAFGAFPPAGGYPRCSTRRCPALSAASTWSIWNDRSETYVAASATARPTAARRTTPNRSRARSEKRPSTSALGVEHVSDLADRADQRRADRIELPAQVADVGLDDVRVAGEVVLPHVLEDLALREHPPRVVQEVAQEGVLGGGQIDPGVAAVHLMAILVESDVGEAEHLGRRPGFRAAQDRVDTRDHLGQAEGLRHVVVAAGPQRLDLVGDAVLGGEEEDGGPEAALAQAPADVDPGQVGQHPVEHDQVGLELHDGRDRAAAGALLTDDEALVAQRRRDRVDDRWLVVDDQDPPRVARVVRAHPLRVTTVPGNLL